MAAVKAYDELGAYLEDIGVSFDIIDEALVREMTLEGGSLVGEHVTYESVFVPDGCFLECADVMDKLALCSKLAEPCIDRKSRFVQARKLLFEGGDEGYLICNFANETVSETIGVESNKVPYYVDLQSGETYTVEYERDGAFIKLPISLGRGDGFLLYLSDAEQDAMPMPRFEKVEELTEIRSFVSRRYVIDPEKGPTNLYPERVDRADTFAPWPDDFSGEVTYETKLARDLDGAYLDLGAVNHWTKIYLNGEKVADATMPPYRVLLGDVKGGDELKIVVANTISQACTHTDYFEVQDKKDVGTYHDKMKLWEAKSPAGGLFGPVALFKKV